MTTRTDTERYANGDCLLLAQAIADLTDWPIVAVLEQWVAQGTTWARGHITVRHPDGHLIDVTGRRTEADIVAEWDANTITEISHIRELADYGWGPQLPSGRHLVRTDIDTHTRDLAATIVASL